MLLWVWIVEGIWHRYIWRSSSSALQLWNCRSSHTLRRKRSELSFTYLLPLLDSLAVSLDRSWACSLSTWDMTESLLVIIVEVIFSGFLSANSNICSKKSVSSFYVYVLVTLSQCLGWEDPLEKGMTTHSSVLAWRIP